MIRGDIRHAAQNDTGASGQPKRVDGSQRAESLRPRSGFRLRMKLRRTAVALAKAVAVSSAWRTRHDRHQRTPKAEGSPAFWSASKAVLPRAVPIKPTLISTPSAIIMVVFIAPTSSHEVRLPPSRSRFGGPGKPDTTSRYVRLKPGTTSGVIIGASWRNGLWHSVASSSGSL